MGVKENTKLPRERKKSNNIFQQEWMSYKKLGWKLKIWKSIQVKPKTFILDLAQPPVALKIKCIATSLTNTVIDFLTSLTYEQLIEAQIWVSNSTAPSFTHFPTHLDLEALKVYEQRLHLITQALNTQYTLTNPVTTLLMKFSVP